MNKLLLDEQPILVLPQLATIIGLNEAIILQQVHYWIKQNESKNRNIKEGFYWVYNTFHEWEKQFPFWSGRTIKRTFKKLEDEKLLIVNNYNKKTYDRTKWYRIDYKQLGSLAVNHNDKVAQCIVPNCHDGVGHNGNMDGDKMARPIPETNTETNHIYTIFEYWNSKGIIKHRKMNKQMESHINARLKEYSVDELKAAIDNFATILNGNQYYWTHKWSLQDFMRPNNVIRFVDDSMPLSNFVKAQTKQNNPVNVYDPRDKEIAFQQFINNGGNEEDFDWITGDGKQ